MRTPFGPFIANEFQSYHEKHWLNKTLGKQIGVSPLTGNNVKPSCNGAICDNLLHCNFLLF